MAGSAYFILEGADGDGLGASISTAGNFDDGSSGVQEFIVGTRNGNATGAFIYSGVSDGAGGLAADGANLSQFTFETSAGLGTGTAVIGGYDFNNDGIADVAIGAPLADSGIGEVYILYGGNTDLDGSTITVTDLDGTVGEVIEGLANSDGSSTGFGLSLGARLLPFGRDTLLIGAPEFGVGDDAQQGAMATVGLFADPGGGTSLRATFSDNFTGENGGDKFGTSIANINNLTDLISVGPEPSTIIGAPGTDGDSSDEGFVRIQTPYGDILIEGAGLGDAAGTVVSSAGDLNADGYDDALIAAPFADDGALNGGTVYVLFGRDHSEFFPVDGVPATFDLGDIQPADGISKLSGGIVGGNAGVVTTNLGDVSGDGIDDILIGGFDALGAGRAYLVFGGAGVGDLDLESLDGTNGFILSNIDIGLFADPALDTVLTAAGLGDVNNDGIADFALGTPDAGDAGNGKVFGVLGGTANLAALDALDGVEDGNIDVGDFLDGTAPDVDFIATNNDVTFGGTTTGTIDLRLSESSVDGTITIDDISTLGDDTFNTIADPNTPEGTGTYGTLTVIDDDPSDDRWIYALGGASLLFLGAGETVADQIVLTASNGSQRAINITIIGEDDPTEFAVTPNDIGFDLTEDMASISGSFAVSDPDQNDNPNLDGQSIEGTFGTFVVSADGTSFTYFLTADLSGLTSAQTVTETIAPFGPTGASFDLTIEGRDEDDTPGTGAVYQLVDPGSDGVTAFFGSGDETVTGTANGDVIDTGAGDDTVNGGAGDDTITDSFGNDALSGGAGNDDITALSGTNVIDDAGGTATDSNYFKGGVGRDTITGGAGDDFIDGDAASQIIGAADRLDGGAGNDHMRGGLGTDVFVFSFGGGNDIIADFEAVESDGSYTSGGTLGRDFTVGRDTVELSGFAGINAGNVMDNVSDVDGNAVFQVGAGPDSLTFWGLTADELTAESFIFV
ncbi:VCBS domain-containing protein [Yoonia sp. GPGPB17]|uniref:beta strand repeat-containing protein n=1 Tax=Yoonia sp. GPGPB17 TaxID=3026147 RepID=UPI0030C4037D